MNQVSTIIYLTIIYGIYEYNTTTSNLTDDPIVKVSRSKRQKLRPVTKFRVEVGVILAAFTSPPPL